MKKWLVLSCILVLSLFLVGCEKTMDITDEESKLIAEYAASLLLKYDRNIKQKYDDSIELTSETEATTEDVSEDTTESTTQEIDSDSTTEDDKKTTEDNKTETTTEEATTETVDDVEADVDSDYDIAKILDVQDYASIKYKHYMIVDSYPSYDHDGVYIEIEAPAGYKLLVLKFSIENKTNEPQDLDFYSKDVSYNIIMNKKLGAKQMLTILIDDMYTYQKQLDASMIEETVLLYQIKDDLANNIDDLKLKVVCGDRQKVLQLK